MNKRKKLKIAKIVSAAAMFGFLALAFGTYFLKAYYVTIAFIALEILAAVVMIIVFRSSCEVYLYLEKELVLYAGINGVSVTYDEKKYFLKRAKKGAYNSVYACTLDDGTTVETMVSSSGKIQGVKVDGNVIPKKS